MLNHLFPSTIVKPLRESFKFWISHQSSFISDQTRFMEITHIKLGTETNANVMSAQCFQHRFVCLEEKSQTWVQYQTEILLLSHAKQSLDGGVDVWMKSI